VLTRWHDSILQMTSFREKVPPHGDRKVGVIWHTQGSGKSSRDEIRAVWKAFDEPALKPSTASRDAGSA